MSAEPPPKDTQNEEVEGGPRGGHGGSRCISGATAMQDHTTARPGVSSGNAPLACATRAQLNATGRPQRQPVPSRLPRAARRTSCQHSPVQSLVIALLVAGAVVLQERRYQRVQGHMVDGMDLDLADVLPLRADAPSRHPTQAPAGDRQLHARPQRDGDYLNAFFKERLRLFNAASSLLERVVPETLSEDGVGADFVLIGFALPPAAILSTQAWSMHREPSVFPSPETFLPERWLRSDAEREAARLAWRRTRCPYGRGRASGAA
ncbi:hypothetical protein B0H15DRAFT_993997 [Mycena belliarum]|uniref:Uncharacterized protein n=1 Tax=Mycena belliarum TaxID=1033014 RepID=A0AAD6TWN1_9AGAR|nr:hypothetical protein B0H15DRAFT_993997 [Mycena belliae]